MTDEIKIIGKAIELDRIVIKKKRFKRLEREFIDIALRHLGNDFDIAVEIGCDIYAHLRKEKIINV